MNLIHGELQSRDGRFALHLTHTDLWLPLSEKLSSCVHQRAVTNELVLGIRPEHITVTKESVANRIKASVHLIESIGAANIIDIFLGEDSEAGEPILLRARTHPAFQIGMGDPIWLDFDEENMHLFDRETDQQLIDF